MKTKPNKLSKEEDEASEDFSTHFMKERHRRKAKPQKGCFASLVVSNQRIITAKKLISKAYTKTSHAKHHRR